MNIVISSPGKLAVLMSSPPEQPATLAETASVEPILESLTPPWSLTFVVGCLLIAYALAPSLIQSALALTFPALDPLIGFALTQLSTMACWPVIFLWLRRQHPAFPVGRVLGLRAPLSNRELIGHIGQILLDLFLLLVMLNLLLQRLDASPDTPYADLPHRQLVLMSLFATLLAPLLEELIFRGFLQPTLARQLPAWAAILLTALIFTGFHVDYSGFTAASINVFALGLLLGVYRHRTGSIVPGVVAHFVNNLIASAILLNLA
jgi:membrane protease YdiL (CAAX protease family)